MCVLPFGICSVGHSVSSEWGRSPTIRRLSARWKFSHARFESFTKAIAMFSKIHSYTEFWQQIHRHQPLWIPGLMFKRSPSLFVRIQQVVVIAALAFVFWLWLGLSKDHTSRPSYPYYDTQGPVPPWREPATLQGNYDRKGEHR